MAHEKLYRVHFDTTSYVVAKSAKEAEEIIRQELNEEFGDWLVSAIPVAADDGTEAGWNKECLPFGHSTDLSIRHWWPKS